MFDMKARKIQKKNSFFKFQYLKKNVKTLVEIPPIRKVWQAYYKTAI